MASIRPRLAPGVHAHPCTPRPMAKLHAARPPASPQRLRQQLQEAIRLGAQAGNAGQAASAAAQLTQTPKAVATLGVGLGVLANVIAYLRGRHRPGTNLQPALDAAMRAMEPGAPHQLTDDAIDTLIAVAIDHRRWDLLDRLLPHARIPADKLVTWAHGAQAKQAPAATLDRLMAALCTPDQREVEERYDPFEVVRTLKAHATAATLARLQERQNIYPAVAASWQAGRIAADDAEVLVRAFHLYGWRQHLRPRSAMHQTLTGHEAAMLPTWRALVQADDIGTIGLGPAEQVVAAWDAEADPVAAAPEVRRWIAHPQHEARLVDRAMAGAKDSDSIRALVRLAAGQWLSGDRTGMQRSLQHLRGRDDPADVVTKAIGGAPQMAAAMAQWLVLQQDYSAASLLFAAIPAHATLPLLHTLQRLNATHVDASGLFGQGKLAVSSLPPDLQIWVAQHGSEGASEWSTGWETHPDMGYAFGRIAREAEPQDLPRLLAAWRLCLRIPSFAGMFRHISLGAPAVQNMAQDATLPDRGLLLGLAALATGCSPLLDAPSTQQLMRDRHVIKNDARLRHALDAFATVCDIGRRGHAAAAQLATWPTPPQLRTLLFDAVHSQLAACTQALAHSATHPATLHGMQTALTDAVNLASLFTLQQQALVGEAPDSTHTGKAPPERREAQRRTGTPATQQRGNFDHQGHRDALITAIEALAQAAAACGSTSAEQQKHAALLDQLQRQLSRQLHAVDKPTAQHNIPNFFTLSQHRAALKTLEHKLAAERLDALAALGQLHALGAPLRGDSPQAIHAQVKAALNLSPAQQQAFEALRQDFRQPRLLWALAERARQAGPTFVRHFDALLRARLSGQASYEALRAQAPQMQHLFGNGQRANLQKTWEAGAQAPCAHPKLAGLTLADTGDFVDLASSGDEIAGSCHALIGGVFGYCLLGRLVDGSKRMLVLKDGSGMLRARAMFRMMHDTLTQQPVLLLSTLYVGNVDAQAASDALLAFARTRADALNLPLVAKTELPKATAHAEQLGPYPHAVASLGHEVGEYWDEAPNLRSGGTVALRDLQWLLESRPRAA